MEIESAVPFLPDAPSDTKNYARVNGTWGEINWTSLAGKPATFAPSAHGHPESDITNLTTDLAAKAPLASPVLTGNPTAPTPTAGDNDTSIATTAFVTAADAAIKAASIGSVVKRFFTASGPFVATTGMVFAFIEVVAGGGAGGSTGNSVSGETFGAGGGGGGAYSAAFKTAAQITASGGAIVVGAAGAPGAVGNNPGGNGGDSSFGGVSFVFAKGGTGAAGAATGGRSNGGPGGDDTLGVGDFKVPGQTGVPGSWIGTGNPLVQTGIGGSAGMGFGGGGSTGTTATLPGFPGQLYGGGGGGNGTRAGGGNGAGAAGAQGVVVVTEFIKVP